MEYLCLLLNADDGHSCVWCWCKPGYTQECGGVGVHTGVRWCGCVGGNKKHVVPITEDGVTARSSGHCAAAAWRWRWRDGAWWERRLSGSLCRLRVSTLPSTTRAHWQTPHDTWQMTWRWELLRSRVVANAVHVYISSLTQQQIKLCFLGPECQRRRSQDHKVSKLV